MKIVRLVEYGIRRILNRGEGAEGAFYADTSVGLWRGWRGGLPFSIYRDRCE